MALNLLYANDQAGTYPPSWYAATANSLPPFEPLDDNRTADVCIVGGGYTGLSAALHLAGAGRNVVLLEAHRVGFGASGRNGGQLGSGLRVPQITLERMLGADDARKLWTLAEDGKALVRNLVESHSIACDLRPGVLSTASSAVDVRDLHNHAEYLARNYGYDLVEALDRDACHALCPSPAYRGGILDSGAGHLHPLNFALGLAKAAADAGAVIHETTRVDRIRYDSGIKAITPTGTVKARFLLLACNGYLGRLDPRIATKVMPVNNFIVATAPLNGAAGRVLTRDVAVVDSRFVVNYFRLSSDGRLLFGGGESYGYRFPGDISARVRKPMARIFPHLRDAQIDYAWGGTLAITMNRLPHVIWLDPNTLSASGYSGHGVGFATLTGKLAALAIQGQAEGFDTVARLQTPAFPGGRYLRFPLLVLAMHWYALRDRLGI